VTKVVIKTPGSHARRGNPYGDGGNKKHKTNTEKKRTKKPKPQITDAKPQHTK